MAVPVPIADVVISRSTDAMQRWRLVGIIALAATVSGCSSVYDIRATIIGGDLAFVADTDLLGNPKCIGNIAVEVDDGPPATPVPGDDAQSVRRGVYWEQNFASPSCDNPFPIKYGSMLSGPPFIYPDGKTVSVHAKPLARGQTYIVSTLSSGSAYGEGRFRITDEGHVVNLSR